MSQIRPIPAIRYAPKAASNDISTRIAPPYDVIDKAGKEALLARDPANFIKIDLPHVPAKDAGPPAVYEAAAAQFNGWLADGTLTRDAAPAYYAYHQTYNHAGTRYVRKMFFARLRLEEFGKGSVFPHEQTFGGPKEDRLCLTRATRCNLSPIFGVYEDAPNAVATRLDRELAPTPLLKGELDGVENALWAVRSEAAIREVTEMMSPKATFIADGHHRYGTSLNYRAALVEKSGPLAPDHPANFVLCVFCAMEDPGCLILPTHRVLPGVKLASQIFKSDPKLEVLPLDERDADAVVRKLAQFGPQAVALFSAADNSFVAIRPRDPRILAEYEPKHAEAWRALGLSFLHAYLLDRRVTPELCGGKAPEIHYVKSGPPAVEEARQTGGAMFLLQPTTMAEMRGVCSAGDLMPQKSTFFFPKLASGLIVNPLE